MLPKTIFDKGFADDEAIWALELSEDDHSSDGSLKWAIDNTGSDTSVGKTKEGL